MEKHINIYPPEDELKKIYPPIKKCTEEEFDKKLAELELAKTEEEKIAIQKELVQMRRYLYFGCKLS